MSRIFTIGHSLHDRETFLRLVSSHGVNAIADVRSRPVSGRAPHFSQSRLKEWLAGCDISYVFLGAELGGIPSSQNFYDPSGRVRYDLVAKDGLFQSGIARVISGSHKYSVAIMCAEGDPHCCHRHNLITPSLISAGVEVAHILKDGSVEYVDKNNGLLSDFPLLSPKAMKRVG